MTEWKLTFSKDDHRKCPTGHTVEHVDLVWPLRFVAAHPRGHLRNSSVMTTRSAESLGSVKQMSNVVDDVGDVFC